ncbi:uncharacterized protein [Asterias amurensis]|uniref:uncharacterized protein isoform X1 n=1 Tax=Asterias amurensis TaxID=7602 RepID=UPI003AB4504B
MTQMVKATWRRDGAVASGDMSDIFVHDNILGQVFKGISHGDWVNDLTANGESAIHAVRGEMNVVCVQPNRVLQRQVKAKVAALMQLRAQDEKDEDSEGSDTNFSSMEDDSQ